jgi:hypothetical protein
LALDTVPAFTYKGGTPALQPRHNMEYVAYAILFYGFVKIGNMMCDISEACDEAVTQQDVDNG